MCKCKNVQIGSYDNQINLYAPEWSRHEFIGIDRCIAKEIINLWSLGIITTRCCCGHNKVDSYIGVSDEFIPIMKELGYKVRFNNIRPNDEDSFIPKEI